MINPVKYNSDGTPWHPESVHQEMTHRFRTRPFADVSDLIGSDWGHGLEFWGNAVAYQTAAFRRVTMMYGEY